MSVTFLVGDIGTTNSRLAICTEDGIVVFQREYQQAAQQFPSVLELIISTLNEAADIGNSRPTAAVFGIAAPVLSRKIEMSGSDWPLVDVDEIQRALNIPVRVLNDAAIAAHAIPALPEDDLDQIADGVFKPKGNKVVVTWGSGIGDASLYWIDELNRYVSIAGEFGAMPIAPRNAREVEYLENQWLKRPERNNRESFDGTIGGRFGFKRVYDFVSLSTDPEEIVVRELESADWRSAGPIITKYAFLGDLCCIETLKMIGGMMGTYLGARAVMSCSTGGVYLCGGIANNRKLVEFLIRESELLSRFRLQGPVSNLVTNVPIYCVSHRNPGVFGAIQLAKELDISPHT